MMKPSHVDTPMRDQIAAWPKAELHTHLDGAPRLSTLLDLARAQGKASLLPADSVEGMADLLRKVDDAGTLEAYLNWFQYTIPFMQTSAALARIAYELVEDSARENVRYLEVRYAPILHTEDGLTLEAANEAVLDGLRAGERDFGVRTAVIICGLRDRFESASLRQAELAVAYRGRGVVAFDLAGGEAGNPPKQHLHAFYYARNNLLNLTVHAGESWGPESIHQALFFCGAHRIGHGTSLHQDEELMRYVVDHQIPLEVCPTSNVQTRVVDDIASHPLRVYVERGVPITINTDSRLFSRTSVTEELYRVYEQCELSQRQMAEIVLNGFRHAFLAWEEKQDLLAEALDAIPSAAAHPDPRARR